MLSNQELSNLRAKAANISPTLQIGKNGVTDSFISELKKQLRTRGLIKVKLTKGFMEIIERSDKSQIASDLAKKTDSEVISVVGFTIVFYKKIIEEKKNFSAQHPKIMSAHNKSTRFSSYENFKKKRFHMSRHV